MLSQATKVMINQLIEVPTLWGDKKLSIGGRGRCYLDFIDSPNEITPLMIDQSASKTYGTLADMIVYTSSQEVFRQLVQFTEELHPERVDDILYLARIIWLCNRQGLKALFDKKLYQKLHDELIELEFMYRQEHLLYKNVVLGK